MSESFAENKGAQIGVAASVSVLGLTDLIGNTLVILIILTNKSMKSPMNYLLVNLAVADIMVGVFLMPRFVFIHFFTHPEGFSGAMLCRFLTASNLTRVGLVVSSLSLVAISFERYFAIVHPSSRKYRLTFKRVKHICTGCWITAVVVVLPLFIFRIYNKNSNLCKEHWPSNKPWLPGAFSVVWFLVVGVFPIFFMSVLYSKVIYNLWFKRSRQRGTQLAVMQSRKRITKTFVIVSVVYTICVFPNLAIYLSDHLVIQQHRYNVKYIVSAVLYSCNSTINPFVYTFQSQSFRKQMKKFLCCGRLHICENRLDIIQTPSESDKPNIDQKTFIKLNNFTTGLNRLDISLNEPEDKDPCKEHQFKRVH